MPLDITCALGLFPWWVKFLRSHVALRHGNVEGSRTGLCVWRKIGESIFLGGHEDHFCIFYMRTKWSGYVFWSKNTLFHSVFVDLWVCFPWFDLLTLQLPGEWPRNPWQLWQWWHEEFVHSFYDSWCLCLSNEGDVTRNRWCFIMVLNSSDVWGQSCWPLRYFGMWALCCPALRLGKVCAQMRSVWICSRVFVWEALSKFSCMFMFSFGPSPIYMLSQEQGLFGMMKKFRRWLVVTLAQHCECT